MTFRRAQATRGARGAIGVVRAAHLGKRASWFTALPDNVFVVAFEPDVDHGDVALSVAYRVARAAVVAAASSADAAAAVRADAVRARARDVLASLDRLRRMKKNATDAGAMLATLRGDLDDLDREIRAALRALDADLDSP